MCSDFFESGSKESHGHWFESWLTSRWYFEVWVVKFKWKLFLNFILRKIFQKKLEKPENSENIFDNLVGSTLRALIGQLFSSFWIKMTHNY
jgi:hypothetical protein